MRQRYSHPLVGLRWREIGPALKHLKPSGATSGATALHLSISLTPRNSAELQTLLVQLNDPGSANYHHYLTPAQYAQTFGRTSSEIQAIESYLRSAGMQVTSVAPKTISSLTRRVRSQPPKQRLARPSPTTLSRGVPCTLRPAIPVCPPPSAVWCAASKAWTTWACGSLHDVVGGLATNKPHPNTVALVQVAPFTSICVPHMI